MDLKRLIVTPPQMRTAELAAADHGVSVSGLMDTAGEALGRRVLSVAQKLMRKNILIICGTGNNGGDGYVAADFLLSSAADVVIVKCGEPKTELAKAAYSRVKGRCEMVSLSNAVVHPSLTDASEIVVDCVYGIGFRGELSSELQMLFLRFSLSDAYLIACDAPSGVNSLNGKAAPNAFDADETLTFHRPKLGLLLSPAKELCGRIITADIGIGDYVDEYAKVVLFNTDRAFASSLLPFRIEDSHKGTFGRLTMVCGSGAYPGAAMISTKAALRSGVGLVNLCTTDNVITASVSAMPECTYTRVPCDENGFMTEDAAEIILRSMDRSAAAVIGCGLGKTEATEKLVTELIRRAKCPLIIDADGINCLSAHIDVLKEKQTEIILTPHPAELARLCGTDTPSVMQDLFGHVCELSEQYGVTVHAKNTQTLTVREHIGFLTDFGCSALAKGGSGDMLAGLIGGFVSQGVAPDHACVLADCVMGTSARMLCREQSSRGILASDIIARIPYTLHEMEQEL